MACPVQSGTFKARLCGGTVFVFCETYSNAKNIKKVKKKKSAVMIKAGPLLLQLSALILVYYCWYDQHYVRIEPFNALHHIHLFIEQPVYLWLFLW